MISATQIRKGMILKLGDKLYRVEEMKHVTPGKGNAVVQTKIRDMNDMTTRDYRFRSAEKVERVVLETKEVMFSYEDGEDVVFMDNETFEEIRLGRDFLGDVVFYLKEETLYTVDMFEGRALNITPPLSMEFEVVDTEPCLKGATVQASYKPAKLENSQEITVPPFIEVGSVVRIDTRDGSYIDRVTK